MPNKYLYDIANKSWKSQIIEMLESLKGKCFTFDELLESLALEGYQIKSGKNIRIKPRWMMFPWNWTAGYTACSAPTGRANPR